MARKVGIDRTAVAAAAVRVVEQHGLDGLSLAAVAADLGIRSPSLYAHVEGLAGLQRLVAEEGATRLALALSESAGTATGRDAARAFMASYRSFAHRHPGLYEASQRDAPVPTEDPELAQTFREPVRLAAEALAAMGVPSEDHIDTIRTIRAALHGWVELERVGGFGLPDDVDTSFDAMCDLLLAGIETRI
jgi:AcrR family transcriptional regulator